MAYNATKKKLCLEPQDYGLPSNSQSRLARQILHFITSNPGLETNGTIDNHVRTLLDYVPCIVEAFKRIKKGSSYYRRIVT